MRPAYVFLAAPLLVMGGCAGNSNPVRDVFSAVGAGPPEIVSPDFIRQSRPSNLDYMPVGVSAPPRRLKARTPEEARKAEAELEALRAANEAQGRNLKAQGAQSAPVRPVPVP